MQLKEYMIKNGIKNRTLADEVGYGSDYIREVADGKRKCGAKLAKMLVRATHGLVKYEDIIDPKPFTVTIYPDKKDLDKNKDGE